MWAYYKKSQKSKLQVSSPKKKRKQAKKKKHKELKSFFLGVLDLEFGAWVFHFVHTSASFHFPYFR